MWVFLDIDGVLVPEKNFDSSNANEDMFLKFDPICLKLFEDILEAHPDVLVGISSSWRDLFTLEAVKSFFSQNIAARIIGFTPLLDSENDDVYLDYRYKEIQEFLKLQNASADDWVAINDRREYYPSETKVVVTNSYYGFDKNAALALEEYLSAVNQENPALCAI